MVQHEDDDPENAPPWLKKGVGRYRLEYPTSVANFMADLHRPARRGSSDDDRHPRDGGRGRSTRGGRAHGDSE